MNDDDKLLSKFVSLDLLSPETKMVVEEMLLNLEGINTLNLFNGEHALILSRMVTDNDTDDRSNLRAGIELQTIYKYFYKDNLKAADKFIEQYFKSFSEIDKETFDVVVDIESSVITNGLEKWYDIVIAISLIKRILKIKG